jgi:hypothetical protein
MASSSGSAVLTRTICHECAAGYHMDCVDPEENQQTPETGIWCIVIRCCCWGPK